MSNSEYGNLGNYLAQTISGGGGNGGDASAANQEIQIATLDSIDDKLPALVDGKIPVDIASNITVEVTNTSIEVSNDAGNPIPITGNVTVIQPTGTNLHAVIDSGTIGLPSGAATSANQTTANNSLSSINAKTPALGQALAAASIPVVLTAAQETILTPRTTITANAGTNLNTSSLALESGGNLQQIYAQLDQINQKIADLDLGRVPSLVSFKSSNLSAFGDLISNSDTPIIQFDFTGNTIDTYHLVTIVSIGATIDQTAGMLRLQSGTGATGSAIARSTKIAKYRAGQGMKARFSRIFATPQANSTQITGIGSASDGYFFGYNGLVFGILHRNNGVDTWIPQSDWDYKLDITSDYILDQTKGNVYQIVYPYLGFGSIHFFVESPLGVMTLVHTIRYPNNNTSTQLANPNLYFYAQNANSGNTTNLIGYVGSVAIFISGVREQLGSPFSFSNIKNIGTTRTNLFTLKSATTYNGTENMKQLRPVRLTFAWDNFNGSALLEIIRNATLGGSPNFSTISGTTANAGVTITSGQSMMSADTAGTTITGGTTFYSLCLSRNSSGFDDMTTGKFFLSPSETWTFAVTGEGTGAARASLNWRED